jgi:hypothetical protein
MTTNVAFWAVQRPTTERLEPGIAHIDASLRSPTYRENSHANHTWRPLSRQTACFQAPNAPPVWVRFPSPVPQPKKRQLIQATVTAKLLKEFGGMMMKSLLSEALSVTGEIPATRWRHMSDFKNLVVQTRIVSLMFICAIASAAYGAPSPIDMAQAKAAFAEAEAVSNKEGGHLWGEKLYGGLFFVDPETRYVVANEPDSEGVLQATNGVYVGTLPQEIIVSNAPVEWQGKRWTMLMWPTIPSDTID